MTDAFIYDAVRSPRGKGRPDGSLHELTSVALSAKVLSGMGTVDMRGGYGVYTWFTDRAVPDKDKLKGDIQLVSLSDDDLDGAPDTVRGTLKGPPDIFHLVIGQCRRVSRRVDFSGGVQPRQLALAPKNTASAPTPATSKHP